MKEILDKIENLKLLAPHPVYIPSHTHIKQLGWSDLELHKYQLSGVNWLLAQYYNKHGCILGDEMGLGKTCQTIAYLLYLRKTEGIKMPDIVICPRSVLENWQVEFKRFSPNLKLKCLVGEKSARRELLKEMITSTTQTGYSGVDVLITSYEICLHDVPLSRINWHVMVVDEGHRLKNDKSLLRTILYSLNVKQRMLLTGTPVQNNLLELYSMLNFVSHKVFPMELKNDFVNKYQRQTDDTATSEIHQILKPFLLRRVKESVLDLPNKSEVILFHGMSALQKKLYKAILVKNHMVFVKQYKSEPSQAKLNNIFMQLRKCVNHPYLFHGIEEEPFVVGEHLATSSGKMQLVDALLQHLRPTGHKVLLFSQMTRMLDIIQDLIIYRGYSYERLDGSTRGDERFLAIQNFNQDKETFIFLLSTRAGGQGINLTSADTVIFVDSDPNPQNDLQAVARSHRFGQLRPVKIIRLIGSDTVEDIIFQRAARKLKLTKRVIEDGDFALQSNKFSSITDDKVTLRDILKFGVDKLLKNPSQDSALSIDFTVVLGPSHNNQWQVKDQQGTSKDVVTQRCFQTGGSVGDDDANKEDEPPTIYQFEGCDYSQAPSTADIDAIDSLADETSEVEVGPRRKPLSAMPILLQKTRVKMTPEQVKEREKKRQETLELKLKKQQALAEERAAHRENMKASLWRQNGYVSCRLTSDGSEDDDGDSGDDDSVDGLDICYVRGDVTKPTSKTGHSFIVHCIDDSGVWGVGGVFTAISDRSSRPQTQYELAKRMKDINLGDCHLIPLDDDDDDNDNDEDDDDGHKCWVALIVAQHRTKGNQLTGIKMEALNAGLVQLSAAAKQHNASVHLPRIGHDTPAFNWYGTERLIRKQLTAKGVPTYIYYYPRRSQLKRRRSSQDAGPSTRDDDDDVSAASPPTALSLTPSSHPLPDTFQGLSLHLWQSSADHSKLYRRYIIAYDGEVHTEIQETTSHIVVCDQHGLEDLASKMRLVASTAFVVSVTWLMQCLTTGQCCPVEPFEVDIP
ncbi:chromodomain-helicase-DNA-binding protein 1-like [Argonauta hians]